MLTRFKEYVASQHLFLPEEEVLLAVSGGRDSACMAQLMQAAGYRFAIAHCNFNLRPGDCDRDQRFVANMASSMGVPFFTVSFDTRAEAAATGESIEEAARRLRYSWFADLCSTHGYACLATAHHRDDSIETFFLNLFRGTGIAGLHGIRPNSKFKVQDSEFRVARPMLGFSRADIDAYVEEHHLAYVEDHTNQELDARRNQLRLRLMPLLRELYPSIDATMEANIEHLNDTEQFYRQYIDQLRSRLLHPYASQVPALPFTIQAIGLAESELRSPQASTLLFELLRPYGFNAASIDDMLRILDGPSGRQFFSPSHVAELHRGYLLLAPRVEPQPPALHVQEIDLNPHTLSTPRSPLPALRSPLPALHFPLSTFHSPLSLRPWQPGDRFCPFGMKGSRLVSDFLKDLHLSRIEKEHVYLLVDADDTIMAVAGLRPDERFRVYPGSREVLRVTIGD